MEKSKRSFTKFRLGEVIPKGWLYDQLRLEADSLLGNLDRIKKSIKSNPYTNENDSDPSSLPIWLEGFISLAWCLNDADLKKRATQYVKIIIENCYSTGWIKNDNAWALICILRCFDQYLSAENDRIIQEAMYNALKALDEYVDTHELINDVSFRWFEAIPAIKRMYDMQREEWILTLAKKLRYNGRDWIQFFNDGWIYKTGRNIPNSPWSDAINNAYAAKCGVVLYNLTGERNYLNSVYDMIEKIDSTNGTITGMFTGDNTLAGQSPTRGFSAAAVSEYINSLLYLQEATGDTEVSDKIEKIVFNVLSSIFSTDMWAYQRISIINQIECTTHSDHVYSDASDNSTVFGLADNDNNTAEMLVQAFPKFTSCAYMKTETGIAVMSYVPSELNTIIDNHKVKLCCNSEYPFKNAITVSISVDTPCSFEVKLRIPKWVNSAKITTGGDFASPVKSEYYSLNGTWTGTTTFYVLFNSEFTLQRSDRETYSIVKGPIVYVMPVGQERRYIGDNILPYANYELIASTDWNYAIIDDEALQFPQQITSEERTTPKPMLSKISSPTELFIYGRKINWKTEKNNASQPPEPISLTEKKELLRFIPYGCTNLRIAELPVIKV